MRARICVKYAEVLFAGSDKLPTKGVVRIVQGTAAANGPTVETGLGAASLDSEGTVSGGVIWPLRGLGTSL